MDKQRIIEKCTLPRHLEVVSLMLDRKADINALPNSFSHDNARGQAHEKTHDDIMKLLLTAKANTTTQISKVV